jgi:hypothetical protein
MIDAAVMQQVHGRLEETLEELVTLATQLTNADGVGKDTYFALGQTAGHLSKAKALLGRDIDDLTPRTKPE